MEQWRTVRASQLRYAAALGMSPAARLAIKEAGENLAVDLALVAQHRGEAEVTDAKEPPASNSAD
jgi:hypothetical protein